MDFSEDCCCLLRVHSHFPCTCRPTNSKVSTCLSLSRCKLPSHVWSLSTCIILQPHCPMFARKIRSNAKQFGQTKCLRNILFAFGLNTKQRVIIMLPNATCIFCFNDQLNSMQKVVSACYLALGKVLVFEKEEEEAAELISYICLLHLFS